MGVVIGCKRYVIERNGILAFDDHAFGCCRFKGGVADSYVCCGVYDRGALAVRHISAAVDIYGSAASV